MATPAVKVPLAVKKAVKDSEAEKAQHLAEISKHVGFPVTLNWNLEAAYAALQGNDKQDHIGHAVVDSYLKSMEWGFRHNCKDDDTKAAFAKYWKTKNITVTIEPKGFKPADKSFASTNSSYCGLRITDAGDLDIWIPEDRFYSNVDAVGQVEFGKHLFAHAPVAAGELPLPIVQHIKDNKKKEDDYVKDISTHVGFPITFFVDYPKAYATLNGSDKQQNLGHAMIGNYLGAVEWGFRHGCKEAMIKDSFAKHWKSKRLTITVEPAGYTPPADAFATTDSKYNGYRFTESGDLDVYLPADHFFTAIDRLGQYNFAKELFSKAPRAAGELPLEIQQTIAGSEKKKEEYIKDISTHVGFPITFSCDYGKAYETLNGSDKQKNLGHAIVGNYLGAVEWGFRHGCKDDDTKAAFARFWKTKNLTITVEPAGYTPPANSFATTDSKYNGYRFTDAGDLDVYLPADHFFTAIDRLGQYNFGKELFSKAPLNAGELPLLQTKSINENASKIKEIKDRITKATGVSTTWNIEEDALAILSRPDYTQLKYPFSASIAVDYMSRLATRLEKDCADDMVKEAIAEVFKGKISFRVIEAGSKPDKTKMSVGDSYNQIQLIDDAIIVAVPFNNFSTNSDNIAYDSHTLLPLF